jgi:pimeloyl-ACP methyl ester carboxylesterase
VGAAEVPRQDLLSADFRSPGSEKIFEADVYGTIVNTLYSASGEPPAGQGRKFVMDPKEAGSRAMTPTPKPTFVTDADIEFFVSEFKRSGFVGGLNYYRNVDRNWALTPFLDGAKLHQPTLFIAGDRDGVLGFWGEEVEAMERNAPNLRKKQDPAGHRSLDAAGEP